MADELNSLTSTGVLTPQSTQIAGNVGERPWYDRPLLMLLVLAVPMLIQITPWWQPADDAIGYLSLARTIADGSPLRMLGSPVLHYAIGYPLLIVPTFYFSQLPLLQILGLNFAFAMLTAYGVYLWARRYVAGTAFFIAGLTLWNASYWDLYRQPLSETAFLAALIWSGLACRRLLEAKGTRQIILLTIVAALSLIVVSTIRQVGIFLAAGYGVAAIVAVLRRESSWTKAIWTTLGVGMPASALLVVLLLIYRSMAQGHSDAHTYVDLIIDPNMTFAQQLIESVRLRMAEIGRQLLPGLFKAYGHQGEWLNINTIIYAVVTVAIMYAWWKLVIADNDVMVLTFPFYVAVYLLWPFDQGTRFMAPMLPVLWLCAWRLVANRATTLNRLFAGLLVAHLAQCLLYFGVYLAAAQKNTADLNALIELKPSFNDNRFVVCGVGISRQTEMFVNLLLDRRIPIVKAGEVPEQQAKWAITEGADATVPGFDVEHHVGRITLFVRRD